MTLPIGSEALHDSTGHPDWVEVWDQWFVIPEERQGGYVRLTIRPHDGVCWYWAALVGLGRPLVSVLADDVPLPKGTSMEMRGPGIWTETTVLRPFEHLTTDLEAFGVSVDPATDVWRGAWGDRVAVGLELDWDSEGEPGPSPVPGTSGYRLVGSMHGEVLLDDARWEIRGIGVRDHWWGLEPEVPVWRGWASRDGELITSDLGAVNDERRPSIDAIVEALPVGEIERGVDVVGWAPAAGGGRRHARALVAGERGAGWFEIIT